MKKQDIRKNMLTIRNAMPEQQTKNNSALMWQHLTKTEIYQKSDILFTYVSIHKRKPHHFLNRFGKMGKKLPFLSQKKIEKWILYF